MKDAKEMRISGEIEFVEDEKVKQRIYEKVSFLEEWSPRPIKPILEIFRIKTGDAHFWTMADMLHESEVEHTKFEVV